jgi:D-serine deaminase-like pyridoxal phosphate-dependent protein
MRPAGPPPAAGPDDGSLPRLGDRLVFSVPHCDPTVNLDDRLYATRGERVEAVWPIVARKEFAGPGAKSEGGG